MARTFGPIGELTVQGVPIELDVDLTAWERSSSSVQYDFTTEVMVAGVEKEILALSGKYAVSLLELTGLVNESMTVRMLINGVEVRDSTMVITSAVWNLHGSRASSVPALMPAFQVGTSLSLLLTTTSDLSINLNYIAIKTL